ncbi:MAG: hypothetical protein HY706_19250 [Candidatus Hydrogenedentes bacterium]|nr:hypothetical protein [Candidatus Hydrogenedentota bacterium]
MPSTPSASSLSRDALLNALRRLSDELGPHGVTGEICLCGGAVMVLAFSARHETTGAQLPQFPHLRVSMPVPEYVLAMKCMAARIGGTGGEQSDVPDIVFLIHHLQLKTAQEVLDLVARYYPGNRIPVRTQYLIEGLFQEGKT